MQAHTFFSSIDWEQLVKKSVSPPFQPTVVADDAFHFDTEYTSRYIAFQTINIVPINPSNKSLMKDITIKNIRIFLMRLC